ncbi:MAG TPA: membrane protein insertion efficiency factor YidD [Alphaproteobacteria bacterium]|nr:membrane protein insertion efficiency factor YidD [Alphaproteobacteria bacterium]
MKRCLLLLLRAYKLIISPHLGMRCRFDPTCSVYASQAIERYGALKGSYLTLKRLLKCHPWGGSGYDPL